MRFTAQTQPAFPATDPMKTYGVCAKYRGCDGWEDGIVAIVTVNRIRQSLLVDTPKNPREKNNFS